MHKYEGLRIAAFCSLVAVLSGGCALPHLRSHDLCVTYQSAEGSNSPESSMTPIITMEPHDDLVRRGYCQIGRLAATAYVERFPSTDAARDALTAAILGKVEDVGGEVVHVDNRNAQLRCYAQTVSSDVTTTHLKSVPSMGGGTHLEAERVTIHTDGVTTHYKRYIVLASVWRRSSHCQPINRTNDPEISYVFFPPRPGTPTNWCDKFLEALNPEDRVMTGPWDFKAEDCPP